ncbi:hypothetical protein B9Z65_8464 [Elsinoe australis]|uniref:Uncharacterized protein n=1 Tax=Elsinoe australis TaxID=40998 RepID=A0A2P7YDV7_9PEZI|nr:hypothetical protein B9Z65_8464 [Elsinoe australis]
MAPIQTSVSKRWLEIDNANEAVIPAVNVIGTRSRKRAAANVDEGPEKGTKKARLDSANHASRSNDDNIDMRKSKTSSVIPRTRSVNTHTVYFKAGDDIQTKMEAVRKEILQKVPSKLQSFANACTDFNDIGIWVKDTDMGSLSLFLAILQHETAEINLPNRDSSTEDYVRAYVIAYRSGVEMVQEQIMQWLIERQEDETLLSRECIGIVYEYEEVQARESFKHTNLAFFVAEWYALNGDSTKVHQYANWHPELVADALRHLMITVRDTDERDHWELSGQVALFRKKTEERKMAEKAQRQQEMSMKRARRLEKVEKERQERESQQKEIEEAKKKAVEEVKQKAVEEVKQMAVEEAKKQALKEAKKMAAEEAKKMAIEKAKKTVFETAEKEDVAKKDAPKKTAAAKKATRKEGTRKEVSKREAVGKDAKKHEQGTQKQKVLMQSKKQ